MKINVSSLENKKVGDITLNKDVFGLPTRRDILARVVRWQRAKKRSGNHSTKLIGEISGTTKKPFNQKGTGNARQGSLRSPQMRGGATMFGPRPRSHAHKLPKKIRALGLKTALSAKMAKGQLIIVDSLKLKSNKTKDLLAQLKKFDLKKALFVDGQEVDAKFRNASFNIPYIDVLPQQGINVYDILNREFLVLTKEAVQSLEQRLK